jgi:hypothetical protein
VAKGMYYQTRLYKCFNLQLRVSCHFIKPCISARLFAYTLANIAHKGGNLFDCQDDIILRILQSFVTIEMTALQDLDPCHVGKTCFCSFDLSFLPTIIDSVPNLSVIESTVDAISTLLSNIHTYTTIQHTDQPLPADAISTTHSGKLHTLKFLQMILDELALLEFDNVCSGCQVISSTMPGPIQWPMKRFALGAKYYRLELAVVETRINTSDVDTGLYLQLENILGELIGRIIRYYLRLFFNAKPPILTTPSKEHPAPDFTSTRSRVHQMISLHYKGQSASRRGVAVADGCISSIFNTAIRRIYDWNENFLQLDINRYRLQDFSETTMQGIARDRSLTESDLVDVTNDISHVHKVLFGVDACRFVSELLTWPNVENAISEVGGWLNVEKYASLFSNLQLGRMQPDLIHFVMLKNISFLIQRLIVGKNALVRLDHDCKERLKHISNQFKSGARNRNEGTKIIIDLLREGNEGILPSVKANPAFNK